MFFNDVFSNFLDNLLRFGLEYFGRFYGIYRGIVVSNKDEDGVGKIKVQVPAVKGKLELTSWAVPIFRFAGADKDDSSKKYGEFYPPEEGDGVWVTFENGDPNYPMYIGGWWADNEIPDEFATSDKETSPTVRGVKTKGGHKILFNDEDGKQSVLVTWTDGTDESNLLIDKDATAKLDVKGKHFIHLKEDEIEIKLSDGAALKINGKDAGATTVLGDGGVKAAIADHLEALYVKLKSKFDAFDAHIHPTGVGPSGPPNPMLMAPPWDAKINSTKLTFPDG